ncbi:MAG: hypothetical protein PHO72_02400 [Sphaerochaeta sp.]|nr:hypothetical protein [Sphaerochaeta sp.]
MYFAYFKNNDHRDQFLILKAKAGQGNDCEYCSAIYVLAALGKSVEKHVQLGGIKFLALFKDAEVWSSSEKALVKLAAALFNADAWPVTIEDVFYSLDEENIRVALQALEIRYLMR